MAGPLVVFGPWSEAYDFGPGHPLTPRRFGPGMSLLAALGAEPGLAPEPAPDEDLLACHTRRYLDIVRRLSDIDAGLLGPEGGFGPGDNPPFHGMHEAAAAVAGGSLRAVEAILAGDVEHAFHPGGGLHHAMPSRAAGFCIYDDPALAIARARRDGLRVLYVDLDVHHGDGVEAIHAADPGVLTVSFHESGRYLFPGTGFVDDLGEGAAAGTVVNVPLEPGCGEGAWLDAVTTLLPELAAAFGPDLVVSQHGCDTHARDPLAHLLVTTTAMGQAARLVDAIAHRWAGGRWLATGGGGYGVYGVVPRAWSHVWLAGAHREVPDRIDPEWRASWETEAARYGDVPLPTTFDDPPNAGLPRVDAQIDAETRSGATTDLVRRVAVPALLRAATDRGWWSPDGAAEGGRSADRGSQPEAGPATPTILARVDAATWSGLSLADRVIPPADPAAAAALVAAALLDPTTRVTAAVAGTTVVGLALSAAPGGPDGSDGSDGSGSSDAAGGRALLALGVAPERRGAGLAGRLLEAHVADGSPDGAPRDVPLVAEWGVAERDPVEPLDAGVRAGIARRLLERAGFRVGPVDPRLAAVDPWALRATRDGRG